MKFVVALSLLVASVVALPGGPGGAGYGGGTYYSPAELNAAAELAHRVANQKESLIERIAMLFDQQDSIDTALTAIETSAENITNAQEPQNDALETIRQQIKENLHLLGDLEAAMAGEVAVAQRQESLLNPFWARLELLQSSNNAQNAQLAKTIVFLEEAKDKLATKLANAAERAQDAIDEVQAGAEALTDLANTRQCNSTVVLVKIDQVYADGAANASISVGATDSIPQVFCALNGFVSTVKLDQTQSYGYGSYEGDQNIAVALDCNPFNDRVEVRAFDQSRGTGNYVDYVYVTVKVCSFSAVS